MAAAASAAARASWKAAAAAAMATESGATGDGGMVVAWLAVEQAVHSTRTAAIADFMEFPLRPS
jgi:hypothetical protein